MASYSLGSGYSQLWEQLNSEGEDEVDSDMRVGALLTACSCPMAFESVLPALHATACVRLRAQLPRRISSSGHQAACMHACLLA